MTTHSKSPDKLAGFGASVKTWIASNRHKGSRFNGRRKTLNLVDRVYLDIAIVNDEELMTARCSQRVLANMTRKTERKTDSDLHLLMLKLSSLGDLAKSLGIEGNQLLLSANSSLKEETGSDVLRELGVHVLQVRDGERLFTPTQLGRPYGLSGRRVNVLLAERGFQEKTEAGWQALALGKPFAVLCDVNKRQGGRTAVQQLKWKGSVTGFLELRRA